MKNKLINSEEIKKKNAVVDNAIKVLKQEFIGIDKQIDEIMDNVRTWYLYPQLQTRPLVVAIWGLSGTGKTSLVKRISQLLDIEKDFVYWNFASISESSSWEIENQIEEELSNEKSNRMFLYDEFQYAATINPHNGEERDNKSGLKPFWELLDNGLLHKRSDFWAVRTPFKVIDYITKINSKCKMVIENGVWVNAKECLEEFRPYDIQKFHEVFNFELDNDRHDGKRKKRSTKIDGHWVKIDKDKLMSKTLDEALVDGEALPATSDTKDNEESVTPFFIQEHYLTNILNLYDTTNGRISDTLEIYHRLEEMNCDEIVDFIVEVYENARKGYDLKFNDSIIFVIGNLDEAYEMSFNVNPDMSPDQFRKITEKISVVDIKDALKKRFRNEQIARLGNIHVIYPSFSKKNFEDIIMLSLNEYNKEVHKLTGYNLEFDDTIKKIIYDEGVYPTHGTRPIFSTVHEIVKSKFPDIIRCICENGVKDDVETILYTFVGEQDMVRVFCYGTDRNEICHFDFTVNLRLKKLRDSDSNDDEQAQCALHESGHFVMYAKLFNKLPEKLVSRTTETGTGGFLMEDIDASKKKLSKRDMFNEIKVGLGGYVAEKEIFGEEMTSGASHDLYVVTQLAARMIRRWGMGTLSYVTTNVEAEHGDENGLLIREENQHNINNEIKQLLEIAENEVRQTFREGEWRKMLKESALYLCENSAMPKEKMQELYDNVADSVKKSGRSDTFYHDAIANI